MANNTQKEGFQEQFDNLPFRFRKPVREEITEELEFSEVTFYKKLKGKVPIKKHEMSVVQSIFEKYGISF